MPSREHRNQTRSVISNVGSDTILQNGLLIGCCWVSFLPPEELHAVLSICPVIFVPVFFFLLPSVREALSSRKLGIGNGTSPSLASLLSRLAFFLYLVVPQHKTPLPLLSLPLVHSFFSAAITISSCRLDPIQCATTSARIEGVAVDR